MHRSDRTPLQYPTFFWSARFWSARRWLLPVLILSLLLGACGQRGDLTLPEPTPKPEENDEQAAR